MAFSDRSGYKIEGGRNFAEGKELIPRHMFEVRDPGDNRAVEDPPPARPSCHEKERVG